MNIDIDIYIKNNLNEKLRKHTKGVIKAARELSINNNENEKKAEIAAKFHDICKGMDKKIAREYIKEIGLGKEYINNDNLSHSKIAAYLMKKEFKIKDEDIINAVKYHTTGRKGMSKLEKIIFLADTIEEGRSFNGVENLREISKKNLDEACILSLENIMNLVKERDQYLHEDTLEAYNWLKMKLERK